ncbi:thioesterase family protein [Rhodococcus sp. HNM0569]|uniref:acyl-CoA thioesterase domain-containing protein n=1 Tax=Rhodococcus sp. HNM0569 TaxID=2716340 RepID=UPI001469CD54|nr:thioesterase family protein [Rhodococcus sp. HNM0569]
MTEPVTTVTHPFDAAVELDYTGDGRFTGHTSPAYNNMVGPFGGATAATLLHAVELHPDRLGAPLSITVNFAGPITDGPFDITARAVRTNRTNQHWSLELTQDGVVATTATAVFGLRRDTWTDTEDERPTTPQPADLERTDFPEFIMWPRNYDMRFVEGDVPGEGASESPSSTSTLWLRDEPARPLDYAALTSMCDAFYPRVFLRKGQYVPAGTVSFTVYFHADDAEIAAQGTDHVLATAHTARFGRGYFDQHAQLWGTDGTLLATSQQIVYFK